LHSNCRRTTIHGLDVSWLGAIGGGTFAIHVCYSPALHSFT
jgi:hypothetical protein